MEGPPVSGPWLAASSAVAVAVAVLVSAVGFAPAGALGRARTESAPTPAPVANFTAALGRLVELVGLAGSGVLALVWARVALSWFSNDVTKKVQAKDRARDALIGSVLFAAAVSGLAWGLAHWVVTGT